MELSVATSMHRIGQWLAAYAPRIWHESLNPGVSTAALATLEAAAGRALPTDYRALYQLHDGLNEAANLGSFFYGLNFLPLAELLAGRLGRVPSVAQAAWALRHAPPAIRAANGANPYWLPLGFDGSHT